MLSAEIAYTSEMGRGGFVGGAERGEGLEKVG